MSLDETTQKPAILVVEDNQETQLLLQHLLQPQFAVDAAYEAETALENAREGEYQLVLMDINLGSERDGINVFKKIREIDRYKEVPVIALTAYALPGDRDRFLQKGFDGYLSKPFTRDQLFSAIDGVLS